MHFNLLRKQSLNCGLTDQDKNKLKLVTEKQSK